MNRPRLFEAMRRMNVDYLVLDSSENVSYASGMGVPVPYGALFAYGGGMPLAYAVVSLRDQDVTLIASDSFADFMKNADAEHRYTFSHYDHFAKKDGASELLAVFQRVLPKAGAACAVAVETISCPALIYQMLTDKGFSLKEAEPVLQYARKVKTPEELLKIRKSVAIEDRGQERLLGYALDYHGETDFEMWSGIMLAMNEEAGKVTRISGELSVGANTEVSTGISGPDGTRAKPGDMGRMDISVRYHGYWCDCTNTVTFGRKPNAKQERYFRIVHEAYEAAKSKLYPGNAMSDVAMAEASVYAGYGMIPRVYTGHQIGCGVNEPGRIVCYEHEIILPNMVVCIEPQQYGEPGSGIGIRLEKVIVVTEHGPEEINRFRWGDEIWN